jgi:hypothetical protein
MDHAEYHWKDICGLKCLVARRVEGDERCKLQKLKGSLKHSQIAKMRRDFVRPARSAV